MGPWLSRNDIGFWNIFFVPWSAFSRAEFKTISLGGINFENLCNVIVVDRGIKFQLF